MYYAIPLFAFNRESTAELTESGVDKRTRLVISDHSINLECMLSLGYYMNHSFDINTLTFINKYPLGIYWKTFLEPHVTVIMVDR